MSTAEGAEGVPPGAFLQPRLKRTPTTTEAVAGTRRGRGVAALALTLAAAITMITTTGLTVTTTVPVGPNLSGAAVTQDGCHVYVRDVDSDSMSMIDASSD